jgi:hypothetical protein
MTETQVQIAYLVAGIVIGIIIGFFLWHKKGDHVRGLSDIQLGAFALFIIYMMFSAVSNTDFNGNVAIAIVGVFGGESIGKAIADRIPKK